MRVLWIVNIVMPQLAEKLNVQISSSGTWLFDIAERLARDERIEFAVACVYGNKFQKIIVNRTIYYLLPGNGKNMLFYTKKYEKMWRNIDSEFQPDIVHIHGTEYSHGLSYMRTVPERKYVISIQGILNRIKDVDYGELSFGTMLFNRTFRENTHLNGSIEMHFIHKMNACHEREMLTRAKFANCVNFWDSSLVKSINPKINIFIIDYNLRDEFYNAKKWNRQEIEEYSIFTNPGGTPLKGIHQLFKALAIVKQTYPQVKLYIPGMGNLDGTLKITSGYTRYLNKLLHKLQIQDNVILLGRQSGKEMMRHMRNAHVVVVPSAIEGTSLILREAMFLGCPCIASFRGGMADYITDKHDGYLYDYQEYPYLAERIIQIFEDDTLDILSRNAIEKAEKAQNPMKNYMDYLNMYQKIYGGD